MGNVLFLGISVFEAKKVMQEVFLAQFLPIAIMFVLFLSMSGFSDLVALIKRFIASVYQI